MWFFFSNCWVAYGFIALLNSKPLPLQGRKTWEHNALLCWIILPKCTSLYLSMSFCNSKSRVSQHPGLVYRHIISNWIYKKNLYQALAWANYLLVGAPHAAQLQMPMLMLAQAPLDHRSRLGILPLNFIADPTPPPSKGCIGNMLSNVMFYRYAREDDVPMCCPCVAKGKIPKWGAWELT